MMAIAAAMKTVEYVPLMMPTSIVKAKPSSTSPPKKIEREDAEERRAGGDDGPAERLVDGDVDDLRQVVAAHAAHVLAHAVEDDDGVVDRVAGDREEAGDDVERHVVAEEGQERERDEQVVQRRRDGADRKADLESERDVDQDAGEREDGRQRALPLELLADDRPDDLPADDLERARGSPSCSAATTASASWLRFARALRRGLRHADDHHVLATDSP